MSVFSRALGKQVKTARKIRDLTQQELADRIGVEQRTIITIEKGESNLTFDNLVSLLRTLEIDPWGIVYCDKAGKMESLHQLESIFAECSDEEMSLLIPMCKQALFALRKP